LETKKQKLIPAFSFLFFFVNFCHVVTKTKGLQLIERVFLVKKNKKRPTKSCKILRGGKKKWLDLDQRFEHFAEIYQGSKTFILSSLTFSPPIGFSHIDFD
jgi:hypothetical protein